MIERLMTGSGDHPAHGGANVPLDVLGKVFDRVLEILVDLLKSAVISRDNFCCRDADAFEKQGHYRSRIELDAERLAFVPLMHFLQISNKSFPVLVIIHPQQRSGFTRLGTEYHQDRGQKTVFGSENLFLNLVTVHVDRTRILIIAGLVASVFEIKSSVTSAGIGLAARKS